MYIYISIFSLNTYTVMLLFYVLSFFAKKNAFWMLKNVKICGSNTNMLLKIDKPEEFYQAKNWFKISSKILLIVNFEICRQPHGQTIHLTEKLISINFS